MKNIKENQLKKCIFMLEEEFRKMFTNIFGEYDGEENEIDVEINAYEGIYFDAVTEEEVYEKISEYYGVNVTSIHIDQCDNIGIWICYKE